VLQFFHSRSLRALRDLLPLLCNDLFVPSCKLVERCFDVDYVTAKDVSVRDSPPTAFNPHGVVTQALILALRLFSAIFSFKVVWTAIKSCVELLLAFLELENWESSRCVEVGPVALRTGPALSLRSQPSNGLRALLRSQQNRVVVEPVIFD